MMVSGPDDTGDMRKIRDNDGIHFMKVGNNKLARMILDVLEADIAQCAVDDAGRRGDRGADHRRCNRQGGDAVNSRRSH